MKKWLINFRGRIKFKFVRKSVTIKKCETFSLARLDKNGKNLHNILLQRKQSRACLTAIFAKLRIIFNDSLAVARGSPSFRHYEP